MVDAKTHKPTEDHTLRVDDSAALELAMLTPPALDSPKKPMVVYERLSAVDAAAHRVVWGGGRMPSLFRAQRAHALSTTPAGATLYEARAVSAGAAGYLIRRFMAESMRECLRAMADALKKRAEAAAL